MNRLSAGLVGVVGLASWVGCDDKEVSSLALVDVVSTRVALPDCNEDSPQELVFVLDVEQLVLCFQGTWRDVKPRGEQGPRGPQGVQGPEGDMGIRGTQGLQGRVGAQGLRGLQGDRGPGGSLGPVGPQGSSTYALIKLVDEPVGLNCGLGGVRIESGVDTNQNGFLDSWEVQSAAYVCAPRAQPRRVFVSSQAYTGNLGGVWGADELCQGLANSVPELAGSTFRAWVSSYDGTPDSRFAHDAPLGFARMDGTKIANSWLDLTDGYLAAPIALTESGQSAPTVYVWTATNYDGHMSAADGSCFSWTDTGTWGAVGYANFQDSKWTTAMEAGNYARLSCTATARLYCFEQ